MNQFIKDIVPAGGWFFNEGKITLREDSYGELVSALINHRINNGRSAGSPEEEIQTQIIYRKNNVNIPGASK